MSKKISNLLITNKSNIKYLCGFSGSYGFMLLTKNKNYLFTDSRYVERAKAKIPQNTTVIDTTLLRKDPNAFKNTWQKFLKKHKIKELGIEENDIRLATYKYFKKISRIPNQKIKLVDASGTIEARREVKSKKELDLIKKSQAINEKVFKEVLKIINASRGKKRVTEFELAWKIKELGQKFGAEDVSFDPIVAFDANSALPHHDPGKTVLKKNSLVLIDMGMKYKGYCSDMTRTLLPPKPSKLQAEVYNLVLEAQLNALAKIKAGVTGKQADNFARSIIEKAGYGEFFTHGTGHGVGLDIHEAPSLVEEYKGKFKAGSVITVEPGVYLVGKFGVRIEDMLYLGKGRTENLTKIRK